VIDFEGYCAATEAEIAGLAELVGGADLGTPVPTCPEWTLARMIKHLGIVHRRTEHVVRTRATGPVDQRSIDAGLPAAEAGYPQWLAAGAAPMVAALRAAGPDAPVWAWGPDQHARFWARRMLHETTVHRADAEFALGREPEIDAEVAADGIDEFLGMLLAVPRVRDRLAGLGRDGETIHLHATDHDGEWMITLTPGGMTWEHGHGKGSAAVRGPAALLLLLAYGRVPLDDVRLTVFGDPELFRTWQENAAL
jgi:uncharacterized protein (TIGR03083 family)